MPHDFSNLLALLNELKGGRTFTRAAHVDPPATEKEITRARESVPIDVFEALFPILNVSTGVTVADNIDELGDFQIDFLPQPAADRFFPRFCPWGLEGSWFEETAICDLTDPIHDRVFLCNHEEPAHFCCFLSLHDCLLHFLKRPPEADIFDVINNIRDHGKTITVGTARQKIGDDRELTEFLRRFPDWYHFYRLDDQRFQRVIRWEKGMDNDFTRCGRRPVWAQRQKKPLAISWREFLRRA